MPQNRVKLNRSRRRLTNCIHAQDPGGICFWHWYTSAHQPVHETCISPLIFAAKTSPARNPLLIDPDSVSLRTWWVEALSRGFGWRRMWVFVVTSIAFAASAAELPSRAAIASAHPLATEAGY